ARTERETAAQWPARSRTAARWRKFGYIFWNVVGLRNAENLAARAGSRAMSPGTYRFARTRASASSITSKGAFTNEERSTSTSAGTTDADARFCDMAATAAPVRGLMPWMMP